MRRTFVILAVLCLVLAVAWPWLAKLPLGRLPGDIVIERRGVTIYIPIVSSLLAGLVISLLIRLFRR